MGDGRIRICRVWDVLIGSMVLEAGMNGGC
jgi:hypothetical protein